jgi:hypothetical protein
MSQYPILLDIPLDIPTKYCHFFTSRQEDFTRPHRILTMFFRRSDTPASIAQNSCAHRSEGAACAILILSGWGEQIRFCGKLHFTKAGL